MRIKRIKIKTLSIYDRERLGESDKVIIELVEFKKPQNFPKKAEFWKEINSDWHVIKFKTKDDV